MTRLSLITKATIAALAFFLLPAAQPRASAQEDLRDASLVAAGALPLTQETVDRFRAFWEWILDAPLSPAERRYLQANLADTWKKRDADGIQTTLKVVAIQQQVAAKSAAEQAFFREQSRPGILASIKHWASMPLLQAALRVAWPTLPEEKRDAARQQFRLYRQAVAPGFLKEVAPPAMTHARRHETSTFLSNILLNQYAANMNIISNMGTGEWTYTVH